jgi:flavin reductase (DIM6/NTAB) family NADH-FMN oxidoreductase RutF
MSPFSGDEFRQILGHYPTGVCIITSVNDGRPIGVTVGSFTSVSLNPPLVAFFPDKKSSTWPRIAATGQFCINVLSEHQQDVCRLCAMKSDTKFDSISHRISESGLPIVDDVVAWIDCEIHNVLEAGDHFAVFGKVRSLALERPHNPLLFLRGVYSRIATAD